MLDTIRLNFENFEPERLKQHSAFKTEVTSEGEAVKQHATVFLNETKGEKDKLTYNGTIRFDYSYKDKYLNIGLSSAPVLLYGTSFKTLQRSDLSRLTEELQKQANSFVDADIRTACVSRLDNSTLYTMNEASSRYIMLLDELTRNRQQHATKKYFEGETIEFYNRLRTTGFYDKYAKNKKNELEAIFAEQQNLSSNELRYEIQNKKSRSIKSAFGLTERLTLQQLDTDYMQEALHKQRIKEFNKHFQFTIGTQRIQLEDFFNTSIYMKARHKRTALDKTLWLLAIQKGFMTLTEVKAIMQASGYSRQAVYRRMKTLEELLQYDISKTELFEELAAKVHAA